MGLAGNGPTPTTALHRVTVRTGTGATRTVVLRRYVVPEVVAEDPNIVENEALALHISATAEVPTPELLAQDPHGHDSDTPTVVMSFFEGRPRWESPSRRQFVVEAGIRLRRPMSD